MEKLHIKKDDTVVVISGNSKGVRGKVIAASPEAGKVIVAGANIVSKHTKARKQGDSSQIIKTEGAIYACKVQLVCTNSKCEKYNKAIRAKAAYVTKGDKSQIVKTEAAMYACKVQLVCPKCNKGVRVQHKIVGDKKVRVCAKCGAEI